MGYVISIAVLGIIGWVAWSQHKERKQGREKAPEGFSKEGTFEFSYTPRLYKIHVDTSKQYFLYYPGGSIVFPLSSQPTQRYYLLDVSFTPDIHTKTTEKSNAGRALVGGIIAGPVGAIVGASRKKRIKTTSYEKESTMYLSFITEQDLIANNQKGIFEFPMKGDSQLASEIQKNYVMTSTDLDFLETQNGAL